MKRKLHTTDYENIVAEYEDTHESLDNDAWASATWFWAKFLLLVRKYRTQRGTNSRFFYELTSIRRMINELRRRGLKYD